MSFAQKSHCTSMRSELRRVASSLEGFRQSLTHRSPWTSWQSSEQDGSSKAWWLHIWMVSQPRRACRRGHFDPLCVASKRMFMLDRDILNTQIHSASNCKLKNAFHFLSGNNCSNCQKVHRGKFVQFVELLRWTAPFVWELRSMVLQLMEAQLEMLGSSSRYVAAWDVMSSWNWNATAKSSSTGDSLTLRCNTSSAWELW